MPTIIDSLVVTLGLDAKNFSTGMAQTAAALKATKDAAGTTGTALRATSDTARRTATEMQSQGKVAGEFFSTIKNQALGLLTVLIGGKGIESMVRDTTTSLAIMGRAAQNIGISVPELAQFRNTIEANGGSAEAAAASLQKLSDEMATLKATGKNAIMPGLQAIGGSQGDTAIQTYMKFVKYVADHPADIGHSRFVGHQLGLDEGSINEALKGTVQVTKDLGDALKRGVPTHEMTARAIALQGAFHGAQQTAGHLVDVLVDQFSPAMKGVLDTLTAFMIAHPTASTAIGIGGGVAGTAGSIWFGNKILGMLSGGGMALTGSAVALDASAAALTGAAVALGGSGVAGAAAKAGGLVAGGRLAVGSAAGTGVLGAGLGLAARLSPWLAALYAFKPSTTNTGEDEFLRAHRGAPAVGGAPLPTDASAPRGIRNNNPGNLNFANQEGATLEPGAGGRFARFASMDEGVAALGRQLQLYASRGKDTIQAIISTYAPGNENDTSKYIANMVKSTGYSAGQHLNLSDPAVLQRLERGIISQENGARYASAGQTVHVNGPITIHTRATDATGIARDLRVALGGRQLAAQANTGLS
jgi:hypothetical protein